MADLVGKTILHYRIIEQVWQGGMGVVYKAPGSETLKAMPSTAKKSAKRSNRVYNSNIISTKKITKNNSNAFDDNFKWALVLQ